MNEILTFGELDMIEACDSLGITKYGKNEEPWNVFDIDELSLRERSVIDRINY